jgi:uncharacterized protein (TIGR03546 family)
MFIKWIVNIIGALNSNKKPGELAAGIAFGIMLALIPTGNLLWPLLLIITMLLRVHQGMEFLFLAIFKLFIPVFDPALHSLGLAVLSIPALEGFFTSLYNMPVVPFLQFNNTLVMGGLVAGIVLWLPLFILFRILVGIYRNTLKEKVENSKLVKWFKKLPIVRGLVKLGARAAKIYGTN